MATSRCSDCGALYDESRGTSPHHAPRSTGLVAADAADPTKRLKGTAVTAAGARPPADPVVAVPDADPSDMLDPTAPTDIPRVRGVEYHIDLALVIEATSSMAPVLGGVKD